MATLTELREKIDLIDDQLVQLLNERADLALTVKQAKKQDNISIYSPDRERQILDRVLAKAGEGSFPKESLERIFTNIMSASRSLMGDLVIAYVGPEYSLDHDAALKQFGDSAQYAPEATVDDVFSKVERGDAAFGVIPARTSSSGLVAKTFDLLMQSNLSIIAEIEIAERIGLFSASGDLSEIDRVYSDASFFSRSANWLRANLPGAQLIIESSLGEALNKLGQDPQVGVVAGESLAEKYQLKVLARGIESESTIDARFVVIGPKMPPITGEDKTSLLCAVTDRTGALRDILQPFADHGITLLKIESRPMRNRRWEYVFFIDIVGHCKQPEVAQATKELQNLSSYFKILGSYPLICKS